MSGDKKRETEASAVELDDAELDDVQGGTTKTLVGGDAGGLNFNEGKHFGGSYIGETEKG